MENVKAIKESVLGLGCWWDVGCREKGEARLADGSDHRSLGGGTGKRRSLAEMVLSLPCPWDIRGDMV